MKVIKNYRFFLIYFLTFLFSFSIGIYANNRGLNQNLNNYDELIGDILNFASILTGFLGAMISILTSISKSSPIITRVLKSKKALHQFVSSMAIPFGTGIMVIFLSMAFRLKINNPDIPLDYSYLNILLLSLSILFICTSVLMTIFIFYIFFLDGFTTKKVKKETYKPELKKSR